MTLITDAKDERLAVIERDNIRTICTYRDIGAAAETHDEPKSVEMALVMASLRAVIRDRDDLDKVANKAMDRENTVIAERDAAIARAEEAERQLCAAREARLRRNTVLYDQANLVGVWVAVPEEDFDKLEAALSSFSPCRHEAIVARIEVDGMATIIGMPIMGDNVDDMKISVARAVSAWLKEGK